MNAPQQLEAFRRKGRKQAMASQKIKSDSYVWTDDEVELLTSIRLKTKPHIGCPEIEL